MPHAPEATGRLLGGRYELHAVVGEGTFGRVYRARDRRLDRVVAVKLIKPWWAEDPAWAERFAREARLLASVSDARIVQIFDVGKTDEGLYYVSELVEGQSLADRLEDGRLDPSVARDLAEQLCLAVARAHAKRIVHRDIKPANVLITDAGQVKLGDFGVARLAEGSTGGTGGVVGTPRYMAPEQARGLKTSPATDVYSVGVVLYEMLAGTPPFTGGSAVELALSHLQDPPPPLPADVPPQLSEVARRALAKDPAKRYRDGGEMAEALARAAGPQREGGEPRPLDVGRRPPRRPAAAHSASAEPTRVAPRLTPRRRFNPAARRRSVALLALVFGLLTAMILGAVLLAAPARVRVPRVVGLSRGAVSATLRRLTLRPAFTTRYDAAPSGTAISQSPAPASRVEDGSSVRIVLSAGPPPVEVPRLVGQQASSAGSILSSLGLSPKLTSVPAPGVQPGTVTGQRPAAGRYVRADGSVVLTVAETPRWRPVSSFADGGGGHSVAFRIRGGRWRILYRMAYAGTCNLIFFCDGPSAQVIRTANGSAVDQFGMSDGGEQSEVVSSGPGVYQVQVAPGSDATHWSAQVEDYY